MAEAKIERLKEDRRFQDILMASQTARLMNIQGKYTEKTIMPESCMAFVWDEDKEPEKTEEELMEELDRNMDSWSRVRRNGG